MIKRDLYAFVTDAGWEDRLTSIRPDAPLYGDYRLCVFSEGDLPKFKEEFSDITFKYLTTGEMITQMEAGVIGPYLCYIEKARVVATHFTPAEYQNNKGTQ